MNAGLNPSKLRMETTCFLQIAGAGNLVLPFKGDLVLKPLILGCPYLVANKETEKRTPVFNTVTSLKISISHL